MSQSTQQSLSICFPNENIVWWVWETFAEKKCPEYIHVTTEHLSFSLYFKNMVEMLNSSRDDFYKWTISGHFSGLLQNSKKQLQ